MEEAELDLKVKVIYKDKDYLVYINKPLPTYIYVLEGSKGIGFIRSTYQTEEDFIKYYNNRNITVTKLYLKNGEYK